MLGGERDVAHGELRLIGQCRTRADHDRLRVGAELVSVGAGAVAGEPLRRSVGRGDAAVDARRDLGHHEGPAGAAMMQVGRQLTHRALGADADRDLDPGGTQPREPGAGHPWIRILERRDDTRDAGADQRVDAGRRAPVVRAGLEGDIGRGAARAVAGPGQRAGLGVGPARRLGRAQPDDLSVAEQRAPDPRIGRGATAGGRACGQCLLHRLVVAHGFPRSTRGARRRQRPGADPRDREIGRAGRERCRGPLPSGL